MTEAPYDYAEFRRVARILSTEHRKAIDLAEDAGKDLARAEAEYHKQLAVAVGKLRTEGATVAETRAKGTESVSAAKEARDVAAVVDRAAMERVRLARDDRAVLLTLGAWSRSAGDWE